MADLREARGDADDAWARRTTAAIAGGSRAALGELFERRFDVLHRTVRDRIRCDEHFALDCVQEAMIKVADSMIPLGGAAALDAWLRRVVLSAALDRLRQERSRQRRECARPLDGTAALGFPAIDLEELRREVDALASDERHLLDLRFRRGLTLAQAGEATGLAPKAVDSRIRRALARLRSVLAGSVRSEAPAEPSPSKDRTTS